MGSPAPLSGPDLILGQPPHVTLMVEAGLRLGLQVGLNVTLTLTPCDLNGRGRAKVRVTGRVRVGVRGGAGVHEAARGE